MMVAPGLSAPEASASLIIAFAIRSLTEPAGLKYSSLARMVAFAASMFSANFSAAYSGVLPIRSAKLFLISDMVFTAFQNSEKIKSIYQSDGVQYVIEISVSTSAHSPESHSSMPPF